MRGFFISVIFSANKRMLTRSFLRVLSGDPAGYGAEGARVFAIYENFPV
ncbi:DNA-packaging protein [Escherichia coli]|nr:DNA-packaging protein [Escherichia coli]DAG14273.1 MAG TPA: hypothetical protein [Caudoviricetes sp.]EFO2410716.1 DNA-packaging protein [Escherichia coli]NBJ48209.1 DNA-packaging protein [Escherichia coli]RBL16002.1 DNA-packaging protein [Escherichia coli]